MTTIDAASKPRSAIISLMAVQRSTPMDAPPTRLYGRNGRLLLLGLLVRTLLGQECELSGLVVPEHGVVNGFCAERRARAARLPDGEGCYISCDPGWIESGEQPRCSGGELRSSVACSQLLLPCLRSLRCLRSKDRGCSNRYEDQHGAPHTLSSFPVNSPHKSSKSLYPVGRGTCSTHQTLTAASCAADFCRTCDPSAVPACGPCDFGGDCDAACESITPLAPGVSFCVPDDETVEVSVRHTHLVPSQIF